MLLCIFVFHLYRIRVFVYVNCAIVIDPEHPNSCSKCSFLFQLLFLMPCSCASSLGDGVSSWLPTQDVVQQLVLAK